MSATYAEILERGEGPAPTWAAISADPPWQARDEGIRGGTKRHYATLPLSKIVAMGSAVDALAAPDAYLFLWIPSFLLIDGTGAVVCRAWGFEPKQKGTWIKPRIGTGHHMRNQTEDWILATRGSPKPRNRNVSNRQYWPRAEHSTKPPEFYRQVVEKLSRGPYLELFGREPRIGWDVWGNQAGPRGVSLPALDEALRG